VIEAIQPVNTDKPSPSLQELHDAIIDFSRPGAFWGQLKPPDFSNMSPGEINETMTRLQTMSNIVHLTKDTATKVSDGCSKLIFTS